jgi:hypothetical protein
MGKVQQSLRHGMGWYFVWWKWKGHITVSRAAPPRCQCLFKILKFVLVNTFWHHRNLFGMGMRGTLSDDIGSLTELRILWVLPPCNFVFSKMLKMLLCSTIYIRTLNHSLSEKCFAEICPQTEILVGHCQLPLGNWLSLNICKLQQFLLRIEGPMLILSYTLLVTIFIFIF